MALHILIDAPESGKAHLVNALQVEDNREKSRVNQMIRDFAREHGYPVKRVIVSGGTIIVAKDGDEVLV